MPIRRASQTLLSLVGTGFLAMAGLALGGGAAVAQEAGGQGAVLTRAATKSTQAPKVTSPVVVELFTSQGCSACPPADRLLEQLADRDDILPLALHVDYWDYLGWKDDFAQAQFTARQKDYAKAHNQRMIYTPQLVVNGETFVKGARPMALTENIAHAMHRQPDYAVQVTKLGNGSWRVQAHALSDVPPGTTPATGLVVELVQYIPSQQVEILRGENAGTHMEYVNVVTYWKSIAQWDGRTPLALTVTPEQDHPGAILLQHVGYGPIVAAARLK